MFSTLISASLLIEMFYAAHENNKVMLNFGEHYSNSISKLTTNLASKSLEELENTINILSRQIDINNPKIDARYSSLFLETLKRIPYILSVYVALSDGTFFQCRTVNNEMKVHNQKKSSIPNYIKYAIRTMYRNPSIQNNNNSFENFMESWIYLNEDFGKIIQEDIPNAPYNPTKKEWYVSAELQKSLVWSDVYAFSTSKIVGMTISIPIAYNRDGTSLGVIALDFSMGQFNKLLQNIQISENSRSYLLNDKHEVLASSTGIKTSYISEKTGEIELVSALKSDDRILKESVRNIVNKETGNIDFFVDGIPYSASIQKFQKIPFILLNIVPHSDFTQIYDSVQKEIFILSIIIFLISLFFVFVFAKKLSSPIVTLCSSAKAIGSMDLENYPTPPKSKIYEISKLSDAMNSLKFSVSTFAKYAPRELVRRLVETQTKPELGGTTKEVTFLFSDIEKFSTIAENLPAEYLILHLSEYFEELTKEIMNCNGVIDKYIGDSIMAMWGAPNSDDNQVINACQAALNCQHRLKELEKKWGPLGKPALPTRIGLHTGKVIVGNIGSSDRMNFTSIGDSVNIASRLEGANKFYGTKILVSENIESIAKGKFLFRVIDRIAVKGKEKGITIFEPIDSMNNMNEEEYYSQIQLCAKSTEAFKKYQDGDFKEALRQYETIKQLFPIAEKSVEPLINRCRHFIDNPINDWDGVAHLNAK